MSRQRVVIIDDSEPIHALLRARLSAEPVEVISVGGGDSALDDVRRISPDLILLDAQIGGSGGFDLCAAIKSDAATMHIPVIFLTGAATTQQKIRGLDLGAADYITKPFDPAELRVRAALRLKFLTDLLNRKAQIDGLTGLWNRRYFDIRLEEEQSLARRSGRPLSCMVVDVDHFKSINDRFGHPFGDEVLRQLAAALGECVRTEDTVCRYGGEEFALLLPNTPAAGALVLAERIRGRVAETRFTHKSALVPVTVSAGVAEFRTDAPCLVTRADLAMYAAKAGGRDRVVVDGGPRDVMGNAA